MNGAGDRRVWPSPRDRPRALGKKFYPIGFAPGGACSFVKTGILPVIPC